MFNVFLVCINQLLKQNHQTHRFMKNYTQTKSVFNLRLLLYAAILLTFAPVSAQTVMYGDTIFWENFGTGTDRADISGRGAIGNSYMYEGPTKFTYSLNAAGLTAFMTANPANDYIIDVPKFVEVPITSSASPQADKPAAGSSTPLDHYWKITAWNTMTIGATKFVDFTTTTYTFANDVTTNIPCSWIRIQENGVWVWRFGYYMISYTDTAYTPIIPDDGHYALISNLNNFTNPPAHGYLQDGWLDHSGWSNLTTSPFTPGQGGATHTGTGRMLFVNCSQNSALTGAIYKRQVTELCRDAQFEFSVWLASVHNVNNNSSFRIEIWSADPGNDPNLGTINASYVGQNVDIANGARLIDLGTTFPPPSLGVWYQMTEHFTLTGQDYCWVVVRNFGSGAGNDIAIDDLVFKPYSPFNLTVTLDMSSISSACTDGLVTLLSTFPTDSISMSKMGDISQYGFYFQGDLDGTWTRLGSTIPIQTQSASVPLELTLPLSEYNKYSRFRVIVATTPAGFGGRCITFTYPPVAKDPIPNSPNFTIGGKDICATASDQNGHFIIKNINQEYCEGWQIKVRQTNGSTVTINTYQPAIKGGSCDLSMPANRSQTLASYGNAITPIVFTWSGAATDANVTGLVAGLIATKNMGAKTITISGTPTAHGTYQYTVTTVGGTTEQIRYGRGTIVIP